MSVFLPAWISHWPFVFWQPNIKFLVCVRARNFPCHFFPRYFIAWRVVFCASQPSLLCLCLCRLQRACFQCTTLSWKSTTLPFRYIQSFLPQTIHHGLMRRKSKAAFFSYDHWCLPFWEMTRFFGRSFHGIDEKRKKPEQKQTDRFRRLAFSLDSRLA